MSQDFGDLLRDAVKSVSDVKLGQKYSKEFFYHLTNVKLVK